MKTVLSIAICLICATRVMAQDIEKGSYYSIYKKQSKTLISKNFMPEAMHYGIKNGDKVLDVGGNDGSLIIPLSLIADTIDYYLEDTHPDYFPLAPKTFRLVQQKINPKIRFGLHTIVGTDSSISSAGVFFDKVIIRETFHHFTHPEAMLQQIKMLLANNGELKIVEPADPKKFKNCHLLSDDALIKIVSGEGFKYISTFRTSFMIVYTFSK